MTGKGFQPAASFRHSRHPLLSSCALASALAAIGHAPAAAQSFQGNVIGSPTNAFVNNSVPGQTTVTVTAPTAIVNWQPNDTAAGGAPITFQNNGTTATFESTSGDYTVLNRIIPTGAASGRSVLLNGTINSFIGEAGGPRGGAVWFYSPNGLVIGSQASIDVGSLLLTTRDLSDTEFLSGNGTYNFGAADNSRSTVTIQAGAQINAASSLAGSYVAVVAPRIVQAGEVRANGSVAYVAAEQATVTINNNLFDIQVQSGSSVDAGTPGDDVTLTHSGSTGGAGSESISDPRSIYMVAIPKNVAITMLVGGDVGYDANMASVENGRVVLSAGSNVGAFGGIADGPASGVGANLTIDGGNFTSRTTGVARTDATARTGTSGSLSFTDALSLSAGRNATLSADDNGTISIGNGLNIATSNLDNAGNAIRGTAAVNLGANANLNVSGNIFIDASAFQSGAGQAGFASFTAAAGSSVETGDLYIYADASSSSAGAQGGDASLTLTGAGVLAGRVTLSASGSGGGELNGSVGTGGNASITLTDSTLSSTSLVGVYAEGQGGGAMEGGTGGTGIGGAASIGITGTGSLLETLDGNIVVSAAGYGGTDNTDGTGNGIDAGNGIGGVASFTLSEGTVSTFNLLVDASGYGGFGLRSETAGVRGGAAGGGIGGEASASLGGNAENLGDVRVLATGNGGDGGDGDEIFDEFGYGTETSPDGGDGGFGTGGVALLTVDGVLGASSIEVDGSGNAGSAGNSAFGAIGNGSDATGGSATLTFLANAIANPATVDVVATATASNGFTIGGNAVGGSASLSINGAGGIAIDTGTVSALATGGSNTSDTGTGGNATGGDVSISVENSTLSIASLTFDASGIGGAGTGGTGGNGIGGTASFGLVNASFDTNGDLEMLADGLGGFGGLRGGDGAGGTVDVTINGGSSLLVDDADLRLYARGNGGSAAEIDGGEVAGAATGGNVSLSTAGAVTAFALGLDASATGGESAGTGGSADAGTIAITGTGGLLDINSLVDISAEGRGGDGFSGGDATGGAITIALSGGTSLTTNTSLDVQANAFGGGGGQGGDGGNAVGGSIDFTIADASTDSDIEVGYGIQFDAAGVGGRATNTLSSGTGTGGTGGDGTGGRISVSTGGATIDAPFFLSLSAYGNGGTGQNQDGDGGTGIGGEATLDLTGSTITTNSISVNAGAQGGDGAEFGYGTGGDGGDAIAGAARLLMGGGTITTPSLSVYATANAGNGGNGDEDAILGLVDGGAGGNATGGTASLFMQGGSLTLATGLVVDAGANGGDGGTTSVDTAAGIGGSARAGGYEGDGGATVSLTGGATLETPVLSVMADAMGGRGGYSLVSQPDQTGGADGGSAFGGFADVSITASDLIASQATIQSRGTGGSADYGTVGEPPALSGAGTGGRAELVINGGSANFDSLLVEAMGVGGGSPLVGTGNAQGGTARINATGGSISVANDLSLVATGESRAGSGLAPIVAGGIAEFSASDGTIIDITSGGLTIAASAALFSNAVSEGDDSNFDTVIIIPLGAGEGQATGGTATLALDGVTLDLPNGLVLDARAYVEPSGASSQGGTTGLAITNGGALSAGGVQLLANGQATDGASAGTGQGGVGAGGTASLLVNGGSLDSNSILIDVSGTGGASTTLTAGGSGTGGNATIDVLTSGGQTGTLSAQSLTARADGIGGAALIDTDTGASGMDGGAGTGGSIAMAVSGILTLAGGEGGSELLLSADGQGGNAFAGGLAGAGSGGSVSLTIDDAPNAAILASTITLSADGVGGLAIDPADYSTSELLDLSASSGGSGNGGAVTLTVNGGTISASQISASATGTGQNGANAIVAGAGGNGGEGQGGSFSLMLGGGILDAPLSALIGATAGSGGGGNGAGTGGNGGDAAGGSFAIALAGDNETFTLPGGLSLDLSAVAGDGGDAGNAGSAPGANGGDGGDATGGDLALATAATGGSLSLGLLALNATATGGSGGVGGTGTTPGLTGIGGDGMGGSIALTASSGTLAVGDTSVLLDGTGGDGRNGGTGSGGTFSATATGGVIEFGALGVSANGTGGNGTAVGGAGTGGRIMLTASDTPAGTAGRIAAGGTSLETSAFIGNGAGAATAAAGSIDILQQSASPAGSIQLATLDAAARGTPADSGESAINIVANGGTVAVTGDASIDAVTAARIDGTGAVAIGGDLNVSAGRLAAIGSLGANRINVTSGGDIMVTGSATSANELTLIAAGSASGNELRAGTDIYVEADSIAFDAMSTTGIGTETGYGGENGYGQFSGFALLAAGDGDITLLADNGITVGAIDAAGNVIATDVAGGIAIDTLLSGGGVSLTSESGSVLIATDVRAAAPIDASGTDVTIRSLGAISINSVIATTGNILIATGGGLDLNLAQAANALQIGVQGTATLTGSIDAVTIDIASRDIMIGSEALVGVDTDTITLSNIGAGRSQVGGVDAGDVWSLSNDEFGRLSAHEISIFAGETGEMTVGRLDIIGAAGSDTGTRRRNLTGSELILSSSGTILVDGAVALTDAGADDRLTLNAGDRIMVDTATGSIVLTGQGSALGGTLAMDAPTVFVGMAQAWTDISALSTLDAKSLRLGENDGVVNPDGFLRAGAMEFGVSQGLYIQNSGAATAPPGERAGFTAGSGGVTIVTRGEGQSPVEIAINGRQQLQGGSIATGVDIIPLLQLRGQGNASMANFDARSTANGCLIVTASCGPDIPDTPEPPTGIPQQDVIRSLEPNEPFDGEGGLIRALNPPIIQFAEILGTSSDPVIDEPVTGTANESLWLGDAIGSGPGVDQQVTGTRKDDDEPEVPTGDNVDEQVTGTRNENLDEQVTGTRNDSRDEAERPNP